MNKIEKLFRKISKKDRDSLLSILELIMSGKTKSLDLIKLKDTDMYRVRHMDYMDYRIIFHYENKEVVVDSIKLRNENTYK